VLHLVYEFAVFVDELKRTRGFEIKLMNIVCSFRYIRNPRAQSRLHWQLPASCVQYHRMQDRPTILLR
jgi:hypothetical protein